MASRDGRSAKRQKQTTTVGKDLAHSADLVDDIVAVKVGGRSGSSVQRSPDPDNSEQEVIDDEENSDVNEELGEGSEQDEQALPVPELDCDDQIVDATSLEKSAVNELATTTETKSGGDDTANGETDFVGLSYLYRGTLENFDYNPDSDPDYVYEEQSDHDSIWEQDDVIVDMSAEFPERIFHVHKNVLCQSSGLFQAATRPERADHRKKPIDLSEDDPEIFALYLQWLYMGIVAVRLIHEDSDEEESDEVAAPEYDKGNEAIKLGDVSARFLIKSYVLGDRLMDPLYQDEIMEILLDMAPFEVPTYDTIRIA